MYSRSMPSSHASYSWPRIGGHLALDLCNTVSWRLDPQRLIDRLTDWEALADWFGPLTNSPDYDAVVQRLRDDPKRAVRSLSLVRELRDATTRVLDGQLGYGHAAPSDVERIATAWRSALAVATTPTALPLSWTSKPNDPDHLVHSVALSIADLVHRPDLSRLRRCDGEGCGWLFLDTTRNHSRRWCDPLDCGNRARVRRYAARQRTISPQP
jgi:predicted RNA-binding Zn ribbon-like protein